MKNFKTLSSLLLTVGIVSVQAVPVQMPGGNWYDVVASPVIEWSGANAAASSSSYSGMAGHLVTITTADEDAFVLGLVYAFQAANQISVPDGSEFWAGGFQDGPDAGSPTRGWTWVNGEGAFPGDNSGPGYANWSQSLTQEPNDTGGFEQYLGLGLLGYISPNTWNDEGNTGLIGGYVVEYERTGVPEGGVGIAGLLAILGLIAARRGHKPS